MTVPATSPEPGCPVLVMIGSTQVPCGFPLDGEDLCTLHMEKRKAARVADTGEAAVNACSLGNAVRIPFEVMEEPARTAAASPGTPEADDLRPTVQRLRGSVALARVESKCLALTPDQVTELLDALAARDGEVRDQLAASVVPDDLRDAMMQHAGSFTFNGRLHAEIERLVSELVQIAEAALVARGGEVRQLHQEIREIHSSHLEQFEDTEKEHERCLRVAYDAGRDAGWHDGKGEVPPRTFEAWRATFDHKNPGGADRG